MMSVVSSKFYFNEFKVFTSSIQFVFDWQQSPYPHLTPPAKTGSLIYHSLARI